MNVYICYRWSNDEPGEEYSWKGAQIVVAPDEESAGRYVVDREYAPFGFSGDYHDDYDWPKRIVKLDGVSADGDVRILYNDDER